MNDESIITKDIIQDIVQKHRQRKVHSIENEWGRNFVIYKDVFSPFIAPSGRVGLSFASLPIFKDKNVLDIGCGSGIIASLLVLNGARNVLGIDINKSAINNAEKNARSCGLDSQLEFRCGDCLSALNGDEKFDIVYADLPFTDGKPQDMLESAFYDPGLSTIRKLISEFPKHKGLSNATLYIVTSDTDDFNLRDFANNQGLSTLPLLDMYYPWIKISVSELKRVVKEEEEKAPRRCSVTKTKAPLII